MKIVKVSALPMSAPVPHENRHRTDLGTKVKSDATLIRVETDTGLIGIGAALGTPPIVAAIIDHELAPEVVGEAPMSSDRTYQKINTRPPPRPGRGLDGQQSRQGTRALRHRLVRGAGVARRSRRPGGGTPLDNHSHRLGRARVHPVRLPGSA